ncbi:MAG TPA: hypothetical protein VD995_30975 [Azospirillum sp.]|nr:hypothetical protein [Azospirillum sp.]
MEVLTQVEPAGCGQPLTHPVGMPADRLRHEVLIALDRRPTTLHAGLAALASAVCRPGARPLHPALRPMTPETWRIWRESRTAPGALPLPPMRNGVRPPLVFGLPARAGDWGCRLHLHGWTLDELDRKGMADRPCTAPAVERLARADGLVLLVPAADALDREARKSLIARVQALAAALGECGADGSLRVCLCLLDQEVLFRRLGSGAARPQDVAYHDPRKAAQLVALYVGRSARLEDMGEPLRRFGIAHSVVFAAVGADGSPIGLASWSAAMRAIVGSSA